MSAKINLSRIIHGHFATLCQVDGRWSWRDFTTFFTIPVALSVLSVALELNLTSATISLLVTFGAIFTALLLSVMVLVYDQESKLNDQNKKPESNDIFFNAKKKLLRDLYFNISYSIISSLVLIGACFTHSIIDNLAVLENASPTWVLTQKLILTPLAMFVAANIFLTITMIVKRMHSLLTMNN